MNLKELTLLAQRAERLAPVSYQDRERVVEAIYARVKAGGFTRAMAAHLYGHLCGAGAVVEDAPGGELQVDVSRTLWMARELVDFALEANMATRKPNEDGLILVAWH